MGMNRREIIKAGVLAGGGVVVAGTRVLEEREASAAGLDPTGKESVRSLPVLKKVPPKREEDTLLRMQRELVRAMAKPVEQRRWVMVIDTRKCVGCHACTIACVAENKLPPGVVYRPVLTEERGEFPDVQLRFTPRPCMHCDNPSCIPVCPVTPVKATWKRPDRTVVIDYDRCIGCGLCVAACPYGARALDSGRTYSDGVPADMPAGAQSPVFGPKVPNEAQPNNEYAKSWLREAGRPPISKARKCHFCLHRLEVGQLPACTSTCIGRATYFGDASDRESLVAELIAKQKVQTLLPEKGTQPRVYYIV